MKHVNWKVVDMGCIQHTRYVIKKHLIVDLHLSTSCERTRREDVPVSVSQAEWGQKYDSVLVKQNPSKLPKLVVDLRPIPLIQKEEKR